MQVFGLPGQIIRNGRAASRLLAAKAADIEAERRRDAVVRWRQAMEDGLGADLPLGKSARAALASAQAQRQPKRMRQPKWPPALVEPVEAARLDHPMRGKRKIDALLNSPLT